MKALYIECNMGVAGDMLMAALLELHDNRSEFLKKLNKIGIPNVVIKAESSSKCGIVGTHINVKINGHDEHHHKAHNHNEKNESNHHHNDLHSIHHIIHDLNISASVKKNVTEVYNIIAEAESQAHGVPVSKIHFHEVGEMDAIADITGVCMLIEELAVKKIIVSPINVGSGHVKCAHGILPVPAPATATILKGLPFYSDDTQGELCTPTGAALIKHFATPYASFPMMTVSKIGYGMGTKDFDKANCVRVFLGEITETEEQVVEIVCNLDDMTGENITYAQQILLDEGALDVYTSPIIMKKGRQGVCFTCMCNLSDKEKLIPLIFKHIVTSGVRVYQCNRFIMQREILELNTKHGKVRLKKTSGFGVERLKFEHDDLAAIAKKTKKSLTDIVLTCLSSELVDSENNPE